MKDSRSILARTVVAPTSRLALGVLALTLAGCPDEDPTPAADTGTEDTSGGDTSVADAPDTGTTDTSVDTGGEDTTGEDTTTDTAVDVAVDVAPDVPPDVPTDTTVDASDTAGDVALDAPDTADAPDAAPQDCAGVPGGSATRDECGVCDDDPSNDNTECTQDCEGTWGGTATTDDCGVCDDDSSNDNDSCAMDCAGVWDGASTRDDCGVCDDNAANDNTTCVQDCAGTWGGTATTDDCGVCDDNAANDNTTCVQDCAGTWDGSATEDDCGVCDTNPANDNTTCVQDCAGTWGGTATEDDCGVCDDDPTNDDACFGERVIPTSYVDTYISPNHTAGHGEEMAISFGFCRICPTFGGACTGVPSDHERTALLTWPFVSESVPDGATIESVEVLLRVDLTFEYYDIDDEVIIVSELSQQTWDVDVTWSTMHSLGAYGTPLTLDAPQPPPSGPMSIDVTTLYNRYAGNVDLSGREHFSIGLYSEQCYHSVASTDLDEDEGPRLRIRYRTD